MKCELKSLFWYPTVNQIVHVDIIPNLYQSFHKAKVLCFLDLLFFLHPSNLHASHKPSFKNPKTKKKIFFSLVYRKLALGNLLCVSKRLCNAYMRLIIKKFTRLSHHIFAAGEAPRPPPNPPIFWCIDLLSLDIIFMPLV